MPISDLFPKAGITFWDVAHEANAGFICDGYTRACGEIAMCIGQNGPGITNLVTPVKTAYWNHTPMLLVTPQAANRTIGQGGFQEVPQMALFEDMVCYQEEVRDAARIAEVLNRVIEQALRRSAPAQINVPRDIWTAQIDIELPATVELERQGGGTGSIAEAARLLSQAQFPVNPLGRRRRHRRCHRATVCVSPNASRRRSVPATSTTTVFQDLMPWPSDPLATTARGPRWNSSGGPMSSWRSEPGSIPSPRCRAYGIDYWPGDAAVIQVDMNSRPNRTHQEGHRGYLRRCQDSLREAILEHLSDQCWRMLEEQQAQRELMVHQTKSRLGTRTQFGMDHEADEDPKDVTWNAERAQRASA